MNGARLRAAALGAALLVGVLAPVAAAAREPVILVLSGGGARGAAHVGVLKELEAQGVPLDGIVGTSMGALVGGLYAAGLSAAELERLMLESDWAALFSERPDRALENYRRKQDEREFAVRARLRLDRWRPSLPLGAMSGRRVRDFLRAQTAPVAGVHDFSRLPIPFRAVAADLETGETVILEHGDLVVAMRASMAVPGVFTPVTVDGRHLVDGGIAENLAVGAARRAGPARLIAVDISSPPLRLDELGSAAGVLNQAVTLLMARESGRQVDGLAPGDVLIRPALGTMSGTDFSRAGEAIRLGAEAARGAAGELAPLAVPPNEYEAWRAARRPAAEADDRLVTTVTVHGPQNARTARIRERLATAEGAPLDPVGLQREAERARASGRYDSVDLVVTPEGEAGARVELELVPSAHGSDSLLFSLALLDDFAGSTGVDLGARWIARDLDRHESELRADLRLGQRQTARLELRRPLGTRHPLFAAAAGGYREEPFALFLDDSFFLSLRRRDLFASLDLGAELDRWGEVRMGAEQRWSRLRPSSEQGFDVGTLQFDELLAYARLGVDTFDDAMMPGRGQLVRAGVTRVMTTDLDEQGTTFGELLAQRAWRWRETRLVAGLELADTLAGTEVFPRVEAGGLFRLSGFAAGELRGSRLALGTLRLSQRIAGAAARNPVYLGASLELGEVAWRAERVDLDGATLAGSLHLAVDSVLGPIYVYVGFAEQGNRSWGFSLGRTLD